jgi:hypothetical protein
MLISNHPDDERLAALAEGDTDASADATLGTHVASCDRCAAVVADLGILRSALAELPDVPPHRPLRLIPPVEAEPTGAGDRLGHWVRRLFAPALTAGAALAMVGVVGTAMPQGMGGAEGAALAPEESVRELSAAASERAADAGAAAGGAEASAALEFAAPSGADVTDSSDGQGEVTAQGDDATEERLAEDDEADSQVSALSAERSPWPMVLFTGVALMIAAALLRWILAPRAG